MDVAVVGSRNIDTNPKSDDVKFIYDTLDKLNIKKIISGGARGVDTIAKNYTLVNRNIRLEEIIPNWKKNGKIAGIIRNGDIVKASNLVIAFWDGKSSGTKNSIYRAIKAKKGLMVYVKTDKRFERTYEFDTHKTLHDYFE